jgi:MoaA/NifB/PqqE/SkfB family radical SAM enzyme
LSIIAKCNRHCRFCFATETLSQLGSGVSRMSWETFERALDFVQRSGIGEARLLGGEPTIHPDFVRMVDRVLERGLGLLVFSGGLIPGPALHRLERTPIDRVGVLVNVLRPGEGRPSERARQALVFQRLGPRVVLGLNIDSPAVELDFLLEAIERYGLQRHVRLGLSHPILGGANNALHPRDYPAVGRRITEFGLRARELGVHLDLDCGWVPCMFPAGALRELGKGPAEVGLRCNPILDVLPDGRVISCYPLARDRSEELTRQSHARDLVARFTRAQSSTRTIGLYRDCAECSWQQSGQCVGGCLAAGLRRLRHGSFTLAAPADPAPPTEDSGRVNGHRILLPILDPSDLPPVPSMESITKALAGNKCRLSLRERTIFRAANDDSAGSYSQPVPKGSDPKKR